MFTRTNTIDAVLAQFTKTITKLTEVRDAHTDDAANLHERAAAAKTAAFRATAEAKRADSIIAKLNALVS